MIECEGFGVVLRNVPKHRRSHHGRRIAAMLG